ncbi:hypothetical protein N752_21505 [Desulforamulus aquiferis]|nr:hypothetical protein [Desulforamulus aquiferis]RYD02992.1 hypothetical protein N752_21505 [Desulforamulus aquiferis]
MTEDIKKEYLVRKKKYEGEYIELKKKDNILALQRGLIAILSIGFLIFGYLKEITLFPIYILPALVLFVYLVIQHNRIKKRIQFLQNLIQINKISLLRLEGKWTSFDKSGKEFMNPDHPYSGDLNIFGQGSLYQYINSTTFFMGEEALANSLSHQPDYQEIGLRQQAIEELAPRLDWRQQFQASGMGSEKKNNNIRGLLKWSREQPLLEERKYIYLVWLLPVTTALLILLMALRIVPTYIPLIFLTTRLYLPPPV